MTSIQVDYRQGHESALNIIQDSQVGPQMGNSDHTNTTNRPNPNDPEILDETMLESRHVHVDTLVQSTTSGEDAAAAESGESYIRKLSMSHCYLEKSYTALGGSNVQARN